MLVLSHRYPQLSRIASGAFSSLDFLRLRADTEHLMMVTKTRAISFALIIGVGVGCAEISAPGSGILAGCETSGTSSGNLVHDPILSIHGYAGNGVNWQEMKARFLAD